MQAPKKEDANFHRNFWGSFVPWVLWIKTKGDFLTCNQFNLLLKVMTNITIFKNIL